MIIRAEQKNSRQSPRKVRLIANQVKKMPLDKAFEQLALIERKASVVLLKVMRQAVANAIHNHQLSLEDLELDNIVVKGGSTYKRWQPVSRGRAHSIIKRTCHVEVTLKTKDRSDEVNKLKSASQPAKQTGDQSSNLVNKKTKDKQVASALNEKEASNVKKTTKVSTQKRDTKLGSSVSRSRKQALSENKDAPEAVANKKSKSSSNRLVKKKTNNTLETIKK